MSRPKSEAAIQRERDREIRLKRRELKRHEREERRAAREERKQRREAVLNGGPILVKASPENEPTYLALRNFRPLCFCEVCRQMKREDWMQTETICIACYEGGQSEYENQTAMGGASKAPGQREKENARPRRQARHQLQLEF